MGAAAVVDGSLEREECWGEGGERGGAEKIFSPQPKGSR